MAGPIVSIVLEGLANLIIEEFNLASRRRDILHQFEIAQNELLLMNGFLRDADARQSEDKVVRLWVTRIREVACDLEDVIAFYLLKEASMRNESSMRIIAKRFARIGAADLHHKTLSKIESMTAQLSHLRSAMMCCGIRELRTYREFDTFVRSNQMLRRTSSHVREPNVVGLEEKVCDLVTHLVKEENCPRVVSVWGTGGLGKTTIAREVYNHNMVRQDFDCFAWVCVSQEFQSRDVLEVILTQLISATEKQRRELARMNAEEIEILLCTTQKEKKCFVVLDDIWTCEAWKSFSLAFPREETKSKILLTTRNKEVALHADRDGFIYEARPLNDDESWTLFKMIAIPGGDALTDPIGEREVLGRNMLRSCKGWPLAVIVLAGLLATKNTVEEWITVSENVEVYLERFKDIESEYESISWVWALSYDNLPERLQICFQYLGNFPKDYEIPVNTLTKLWMAEGLIAPTFSRSAENMEDASYSYLLELVKSRMVQVVKYSSTGKIKTIRLHHLMLELCCKKAKCDNFLHVVNSSEAVETQAASFNKVRRLAVHLDGELAPPSVERHVSLRSLLFFVRGRYYSDIYRKLLRSLCKDFKLLRVLKFEVMKAEPQVELPSNIGNLVNLRFLSLKNSEIQQLPSSAANLVFLETLDLRCVEWVSVKIPNVFRKMAKLRHLYLPLNHTVTENLSLATLHNLQTLVNISIQDCDLKDLIELTDLRKLVLNAWEPTEFKTLEDIMKARSITFDHLQSLSLVTGNGNGDIPTHIVVSCPHLLKLQLCGRIKESLEDHQFSNLTKLTLEETDLQDCHITSLQKLTNLKVLSLKMGAFKSETMVFSEGGFCQLEFLSLLGLCELKEWRVQTGAMPRLYSLHIGYCWGLRAVPDGLKDILSLKELTINRMYRKFCNRLGQRGADFYKIKHVPSVKVTDERQA